MMKNLNITGVHWKIWFFLEFLYGEISYKEGLGQFADLSGGRGGLEKKDEGGCFEKGGWYPSALLPNKIKMPKNTTAYTIKSYIPIENTNVEKLRFTKINIHKISKIYLKWIQKSAFSSSKLLFFIIFTIFK